MNDDELMEIRERERVATPGPWSAGEAREPQPKQKDPWGSWGASIDSESGIEIVAGGNDDERGWFEYGAIKQVDANFIAHARQDIPALLDEIERLRAEKERVCMWTTPEPTIWNSPPYKVPGCWTPDSSFAELQTIYVDAKFCPFCGGRLEVER